MKYQVTKKQCQEKIDKHGNVCDRCGRKIKPLKTVNNSGEPTYWSGCMHGQKHEGAWGHFTEGVSKDIYDLAIKLVLQDDTDFCMSYEDRETGDFEYAFQNAVYSACSKLRTIKYLENNKPRYTKKQLEEMYFKDSKMTPTQKGEGR